MRLRDSTVFLFRLQGAEKITAPSKYDHEGKERWRKKKREKSDNVEEKCRHTGLRIPVDDPVPAQGQYSFDVTRFRPSWLRLADVLTSAQNNRKTGER